MFQRFAAKIFVMVLLTSLLLTACAAAAPNQSSYTADKGAPAAEATYGAAAPMAEESAGRSDMASQVANAAPSTDRVVIRNANLTIVVDDPAQAMDTISRMAGDMGGFVISSNLYKTHVSDQVEVPEANVTVRVPAEQLTAALMQIKGLVKDQAKDIRSETVSGQDVTNEYTDLQSRLKNLQRAETQLQKILEDANRTEDVLAVHQQLTQIREQIEVIQGQINYYKEASSLSAISVMIQATASVQPIEIGGWQPEGVARDAVQALINTMQFLASATIWVVIYLLPIGLLIFIPLRILWWIVRRGAKNRKAQQPPAAPSASV